MLQFIEQNSYRFEKHRIQTLKNKKRPFRPIAVSIYPDANGIDQRTAEPRGERQARAGLAPATTKKSRPRGGGRGWWAVGGSQKPSGTFEPKAEKARNGERTRRPRAGSAERSGRLANLRANIVPVIRTQDPFRQGRRREARAERAQRFY